MRRNKHEEENINNYDEEISNKFDEKKNYKLIEGSYNQHKEEQEETQRGV